jgi:hypothetical protein
MATETYQPITGELLHGAPFNNLSMELGGNVFCGCANPANLTTPLPSKVATITGYTSTTIFNLRRFVFQVNGISYTKDLNVSTALSTFVTDKPLLEKAFVEGRLGLEHSLVGGGANLVIAESGGELTITITADPAFNPQSVVVGGVVYAFV